MGYHKWWKLRSQLGHGEKANNKRDFSNIGKLLPSLGDKDKKEAVLIEPYMMGARIREGAASFHREREPN